MGKVFFSLLSFFFLSMSVHSAPLSAQETTAAVESPANETAEPAAEMNESMDDSVNEADVNNAADDEDFAFGTVVSVADSSLTILEYNFDTEEEVQMTYETNAQTTYENVAALKEIAANDEVEINFKDQDGKKVATFISKDLPVEDDAYTDDSSNEPLPADTEEAVKPALDNTVVPAE